MKTATQNPSNTPEPCCAPTCCAPEQTTSKPIDTEALEQAERIRQSVREHYGNIAQQKKPTGCFTTDSCGLTGETLSVASTEIGYTQNQLDSVPEGANLNLGCGNPQAIASLQEGETVLDLGSGGGLDCFLAAQAVGSSGAVIGVDMTPSMIARARKNAAKANLQNVSFRLGEIENLPVADETVDVILSNCVINLSPSKDAVFQEAFRALKPGGRLAISDIVALKPLPDAVQQNLALHAACVAGAAQISEMEQWLREAGFSEISVLPKLEQSREVIATWFPQSNLENYVASATIEARKPLA